MNETDNKVAAALEQWGIRFTTAYCGECTRWEGRRVDTWHVTFGKFSTDFHQGLGHRKDWLPIPPTAAEVLYCLLSDASATGQCFADWASDFGYDTDSRKALAIYEACCATGVALRDVFTHAQRAELSELLQEY